MNDEPDPPALDGRLGSSMFRLLQALVLEQRVVQPHYIVFLGRPGFPSEIRAMAAIRRSIEERRPQAAGRLLPVEMFQMNGIPEDADIARSLRWLACERLQ